MRTFAPLAALLLLAAQSTAFAGGFCDGGQSAGGTTRCPQLDAVYQFENGPALPDYRDLDGAALAGAQAIDFDMNVALLKPTGARNWNATVAEVGVGAAFGGGGGVITIRLSSNNGMISIRSDYTDGGPYWSAANRNAALVAQAPGYAAALSADVSTISVSVQPTPDWRHVQVFANGEPIGSFVIGSGSMAYNLLRIRSGIINASPLATGMSVSFQFYLRTYMGQDS